MANKVSVLYINEFNKLDNLDLKENYEVYFLEPFMFEKNFNHLIEEKENIYFDLMIIENINRLSNILILDDYVDPYRVYYVNDNNFTYDEDIQYFLNKKMAKEIDSSNIYDFLKTAHFSYYGSQSYGDKIKIQSITVNPSFHGEISYVGYDSIKLTGEFGDEFKPLVTWRNGYQHVSKSQIWKIFLEHNIDDECDIQLVIKYIPAGEVKRVSRREVFTKEDLKKVIKIFENQYNPGLFISLYARGRGTIKLGDLHFRQSREEHGVFYPGGESFLDSNMHEMLFYFHPGDLKPPLNVYFSGYHSREGFEGFYMMRNLGKPFLLISDSGLEGGSFYLRSPEIKNKIVEVISYYLDKLKFDKNDVIISGLSMGTFGALYYGSIFSAKGIILGKPLFSLKNIAENIQTIRPGIFSTILDVIESIKVKNNIESNEQLEEHIWKVFNDADFKNSKIIVAYMKHDDYDNTAFHDLMNNVSNKDIEIISKAINGRHNDNTGAVVNFFINQYKLLLNS